MKKLLFVLSAALTAAAFASPDITEMTTTQDPATRNLTITYKLEWEPAVVTVEIYTNDARVVCAEGTVVGDVNKLVQPGTHKIYWHPDNCGFSGTIDQVYAKVVAWPVDNPPKYMVLDLRPPMQRFYYDNIDEIPGGHTNDQYKTEWVIFRKIPAKGVKWRMGGGTEVGTKEYNGYWGNYDTRRAEVHHWVNISEDYYLAIYEMTAQQITRLTGSTATDNNPTYPALNTYNSLRGSKADGIDWPATGSTVKPDSILDKARRYTGISTLDLPTEAEWEYACRAGTATAFNDGTDLSSVYGRVPAEIAWSSFDGDRYSRTVPGQLAPNNWDLYDMHGNMGELCLDWYNETEYEENAEYTDPKGPYSTAECAPTKRVYRGGQHGTKYGAYFRSGARASIDPSTASTSSGYYNIGFRLKCAARAAEISE